MNLPFILKPTAKDYLWGGFRLNVEFNKNISVQPLAETWECSTHPDGPSHLVSGEDLRDVLSLHPEYLGTHPLNMTQGQLELPILIKFIDAKQDLSVQVHPDDEYALRVENQLGKVEMWYVVAAEPDSQLVFGFNQDVEKDCVRNAIKEGTIGRYLNHVSVQKGDVFYLEPGTVHAIGAGCLIVEIQESSNITYRLFDYDRLDKDGQKRTLHINKALDVANLKSSIIPRQPMRVLKYKSGYASELLTRCKYFQVERVLLNAVTKNELPGFQTGKNSFHVLLCVDGNGTIFGDGFALSFIKGDCIFVPANSIPMRMWGRAQLLNVSC